MSKQTHFDDQDLELLQTALDLVPNLTAVAYATKLVNKELQYPIGKRDDLLSLFKKRKKLQLSDRVITVADVKQFLPENFFPIQSSLEFMRKIFIAFRIGDIYHYETQIRETKAEENEQDHEIIPGPVYDPAAYLKLGFVGKEKT